MLAEERIGIKGSSVEMFLSDLASRRVVIPEPAVVRAYLAEHPDLLDVVKIACDAVVAKFTNDTRFSLEVYRDPEIVDEYLALFVRQREYAGDILEKLHSIHGAHASKLQGNSGWLQVTTDFAPPGQ